MGAIGGRKEKGEIFLIYPSNRKQHQINKMKKNNKLTQSIINSILLTMIVYILMNLWASKSNNICIYIYIYLDRFLNIFSRSSCLKGFQLDGLSPTQLYWKFPQSSLFQLLLLKQYKTWFYICASRKTLELSYSYEIAYGPKDQLFEQNGPGVTMQAKKDWNYI